MQQDKRKEIDRKTEYFPNESLTRVYYARNDSTFGPGKPYSRIETAYQYSLCVKDRDALPFANGAFYYQR
jgi:hypothetical protein